MNQETIGKLLIEPNITYSVLYSEGYSKDSQVEILGKHSSIKEAQKVITEHPKYKKTLFTKKGEASSKNLNKNEHFAIYDNRGFRWSIRSK